MKQLFFILISTLIGASSFADEILGQDRGGGNMLGGRMIESYIKSPLKDINDGRALAKRLELLKAKNEDLFSLVMEGFQMATWYFIPASIKELSQEVTGIPFPSDQTAVQVFDTQEVWVDLSSYNSAKPEKDRFGGNIEKEKLLVHEAIMAGLNSMLNGTIMWSFESMRQLKNRVRKLNNLIFDPNLSNMSRDELIKRISHVGFSVGLHGEVFCVSKYVSRKDGVDGYYRPIRCSEASKFNK